MFQIKRIQNKDFNIRIEGNGQPLLLVHGFPLDHSMWNAQVDYFSASFQVIAPDLRGFGASPSRDETTTMSDFAQDLANLLQALDIQTPVHFCGFSMGGYIAWQFFQQHRRQLQSLILCDTKATADSPAARQLRDENAARVLQEGPEFLATSMPEKLFAQNTFAAHPAVVLKTQETIRATSSLTIAAALRGMALRPDVTDLLPTIDVPTLVLVGAEDAISTSLEMQGIADRIPYAQFREIANAGHMSPLEQPTEVNSVIEGFLNSVT